MNNLKKSFLWAKNGLKTVWVEERNFRIEIYIGIFVILLGILKEITETEWLFLILSISIVLSAEMINTAIEDVCDKIEPNQNPVIGKIKDITAGFVLLSSITAAIIGCIIFI